MKTCKNCGKKSDGNYCSHCGQKLALERISLHYIVHEIFHFFTHLEKGFLFTTVHLLTNPGTTAINYIEGKRKPYQPPVSYFLVWITIYLLSLYGLEKIFGENRVIDYENYFGPGASTRYAISHLSIVLTTVAPFQALYIYLLAARPRLNYFETLVTVIYGLGTIIALQFLFVVLAVLSFSFSGQPIPLIYSDLFKIGYIIWMIFSLGKQLHIRHKLLKLFLIIILMFGTFTIWRTALLPWLFEWLHIVK
ncbi:MAG TPA: DUF3667 domain-containing protein [Chitinophagaceae bacterium]|nr:DUF3667 domain-containing protein [Chitinophagaceae bacterium]